MAININRCNQGISVQTKGNIDFNQRQIVMTNLNNYGLYLSDNSIAILEYTGISGATYGSSINLYNCDTGVLVTKNSTVSTMTNSSFRNVNYGILAINNSSLLVKNSQVKSYTGATGPNPYVGLLSQSSYVQSFDNVVSGFSSLTSATGPSNQRVNLGGIMIVGSQSDVQNTSVYTNGQIFLDTSKGTLPNTNTGIISDKDSIINFGYGA